MTTEQKKAIATVVGVLKQQITGLWAGMVNAAVAIDTYEVYEELIHDLHWQMHASNASKEPGRVEKAFTPEVIKAVSDYVKKYPK